MTSKLLIVALVAVAIPLSEALFFGGLGGLGGGGGGGCGGGCGGGGGGCGGGGGGCGGGGGGCGGGCGCGRKKREAIDTPVYTDETKKDCNNPSLREAIEESLDEDVQLSMEALNKRLHGDSSGEYVAWCTLRHQKYKFATRLLSYCSGSNANVTCHVFQQ
ncbi:hypothetical protein QR680_018251 [Steinernema hermaphroditum]|uniref:Ground-like domain-containing protein n=1 Tax=Steinernema hermaphroditum TaxID=289476 RepID=A0AA39LQQ2_9BILA|nr:hypothetical protein QR680_018251 [Steinernema hermaphroditum]